MGRGGLGCICRLGVSLGSRRVVDGCMNGWHADRSPIPNSEKKECWHMVPEHPHELSQPGCGERWLSELFQARGFANLLVWYRIYPITAISVVHQRHAAIPMIFPFPSTARQMLIATMGSYRQSHTQAAAEILSDTQRADPRKSG